MRALITGGYGFVGRHLAHHLVSCGDDVALSYNPRARHNGNQASDNSITIPKTAQAFALDITDKNAVSELISLVKPDAIYHLAAVTFIPAAELDVRRVFEVNTFGTFNLLDAVREHSKETRFLYVSSSDVYGDPRPKSLPLNERAELRPISIYGVSKAASDTGAYHYFFSDDMHVVRVRPFTHIGPGQSDRFAISSFARQIAEVKLGRREPVIKVGNLETKREFCDVSDIVRGYREALLNGKRGEVYNLCTGISREVGEVLRKLIKIAEVDVETEQDPERIRNVDIADIYGDNSKALKDFGWKPRIQFDPTLHSLFAYWLEHLVNKYP